jgi:glutamine amidotransferase
MCRLFALSSSPHRVHATFWLLNAEDSVITQSRRNPDGTGLGYFDERGAPVLDKEPLPAFKDKAFLREARQVRSNLFISHIRFATTGPKTPENCHPFSMDGRLFAHNGVLGGLDKLDAELGEVRSLVKGQTDSERYFALITKSIRARGGDVQAGVADAVRFAANNLPVCSINFVLADARELWAFRYPETDKLYVLERQAGGHHGERELHYVSTHLRVHSPALEQHKSVVVASECLDDNPDWRLMRPGELIHVSADLGVTSSVLLDQPPAQFFMPDHATGQRPERRPSTQVMVTAQGARESPSRK